MRAVENYYLDVLVGMVRLLNHSRIFLIATKFNKTRTFMRRVLRIDPRLSEDDVEPSCRGIFWFLEFYAISLKLDAQLDSLVKIFPEIPDN